MLIGSDRTDAAEAGWKIDFLIPASPNDAFYSQIAFFRLALDRLGGIYREARLVAVFGDEAHRPLPTRWAPYFDRIDVEWADPADYQERGYLAQGLRRFEAFRPDANLVVLCDADTVLMRGLGWLIPEMALRPALGGVIAHYHFPSEHTTGNAPADWQRLARAILGRDIDLPYFYSLQEEREEFHCPFYINAGFIVGEPSLLMAVYRRLQEIYADVRRQQQDYFTFQVALALAAEDLQLCRIALPMRYNYPNDALADNKYGLERRIIVLMHYLRTEEFDRHKIFADAAGFDRFIGQKLSGSNCAFQEFVRQLTSDCYPFRLAEDCQETGAPARRVG